MNVYFIVYSCNDSYSIDHRVFFRQLEFCIRQLEANMKNNPYRLLGTGLIIAGTAFAPMAYFIINSIPVTAIALSAIMIGFTSFALSIARPQISPEASKMILETGMENIAALLEELGLNNKAIYLPSVMRTGNAQALIPLSEDTNIQKIKGKIPGRFIVRYGDNPGDMAIAFTAPGSTELNRLEIKPGPTSSEIEQALTYVLTGLLDIANSVSVHLREKQLHIEVTGSKLHYENVRYYRCIGSPIAAIVATVASDGLGKPIRIKEESYQKGVSTIQLEVLG